MNKHAKRNLAATAACAVGLGVLVAPQAALAAPITVDPATTAVVNLLHFNDFHGRLGAEKATQFAGTIEQLRAEYPAQTILLSGGDNIGASDFTSASQRDEPTLELLNLLALDASAVGNHEFDQGVADLTGRVDALADFPYLSANVTLDGAPIGPGYQTIEVDGITVGIIGAVTELTPSLVDMSKNVGVEFGDPVAAVNRVAAQLTDGDAANGEADVIVAEIHDGSNRSAGVDSTQAEQTALLAPEAAGPGVFGDMVNDLSSAVDVIFNGHTHATYSWLAPVPGEPGQTRPVVQSNEYSNLVGQVVLTIDRASGEVSTAFVGNHTRSGEAPETLAASLPCISEVAALLADAAAKAALVGNEQVGTVSGPITLPGASASNRGEESTAAQLVANMYRDQLAADSRGGADIGLVNPGGVRDNLLYAATAPETEPGVVRLAEANAVLPYINNLWTITLTGAQLDQVLEEQWQRSEAGEPFTSGRTYLQLGLSDNLTYVSDPTAPIDQRVSDIAIDGEFITADQQIRVASASFLLLGPGDNFWTLGEGTDARDSGLVDLDAFLAYLADNPGIAPDYSVRHMDVTGLPVEPVVAGAPLAVQINQIDRIRSTGATASSAVEVLDPSGAVAGTGEVVTGTSPNGTPSTTAAVTFTPTTSGTYVIRSSNGSEIPFTLQVIDAVVPLSTPAATDAPAVPAVEAAPEVPSEAPATGETLVESDGTSSTEELVETEVVDVPVETAVPAEPVETDAAEDRTRMRADLAAAGHPGADCAIPRAARSAASVHVPAETEQPVEPSETPGASAPAPGSGDGGGDRANGPGSLPRTGGEVSPMLWIGGALLLLIGAALLIAGRVRRAA